MGQKPYFRPSSDPKARPGLRIDTICSSLLAVETSSLALVRANAQTPKSAAEILGRFPLP